LWLSAPIDCGVWHHIKGDQEIYMIILGLILLLIGFVAAIPIIWTIGIVVLAVGLVLLLLGSAGRQVGGRRHYW
jgi:hypothetical protein